jgi:hypothetical protein
MRSPSTFAAMGHFKHESLLAAALLFCSACSGDATGPGDGSRYYKLASVNGHALPFVDNSMWVTRADLLLRADGSFVLGVVGNGGSISTGTYRPNDSTAALLFADAPVGSSSQLAGPITNDSVVIVVQQLGNSHPADVYFRHVYRRAALDANPVAAPTFELASINDHGPPLILSDEVQGEADRFVVRVLYDSLMFSDGMFYRRHNALRSVYYRRPSNDSLVAGAESVYGGYYSTVGARMILHPYIPSDLVDRSSDTLTVDGRNLVRTTAIYEGGVRRERYAARP